MPYRAFYDSRLFPHTVVGTFDKDSYWEDFHWWLMKVSRDQAATRVTVPLANARILELQLLLKDHCHLDPLLVAFSLGARCYWGQ